MRRIPECNKHSLNNNMIVLIKNDFNVVRKRFIIYTILDSNARQIFNYLK